MIDINADITLVVKKVHYDLFSTENSRIVTRESNNSFRDVSFKDLRTGQVFSPTGELTLN